MSMALVSLWSREPAGLDVRPALRESRTCVGFSVRAVQCQLPVAEPETQSACASVNLYV